MGAPIAPGVCRICGLDKGGEDKQACKFCWSTLSLAQKRAWYQASWGGQLARYADRIIRSSPR